MSYIFGPGLDYSDYTLYVEGSVAANLIGLHIHLSETCLYISKMSVPVSAMFHVKSSTKGANSVFKHTGIYPITMLLLNDMQYYKSHHTT